MFRRIVVPLDGSPLAETILPHVRRLAADSSLEVLLLAVAPLPPPTQMAGRLRERAEQREEPGVYLDQIVADEEHELGRYLTEQARQLTTGGVSVRTRVCVGDPAPEIVRCAREEQADAVAMSTHGRTGLDRLLHGSVAEAVLRTASLPVLLFRPEASALMPCKDKLEAYLRDNKVPFQVQHHPVAYTAQEIAASEHIPGKMLSKVVMVVADGKLLMLALPAPYRVDLAKAGAVLRAEEVRLAREDEFAAAFPNCEVGAMPPFGNLYDLPVYVDKALAEDETIVVQAGTHTDTISLTYADFERLVSPTVAEFAQHT
jgi:Ala-tRNA(Pro) deacylase